MGDDTTDEALHLKKYIQEKNLKNIEFIGFKTGAELEDVIKNSRFTLIPSIWYDNLPNTALESFQYSKPVIASNIGSLSELIVDGYNGYLFNPYNVNEMIEKIKILDDDAKVQKMGANSYTKLEEDFSSEVHYNLLIDIFLSIIKKYQ